MGCDYYIIQYLIIKYIDNDNNENEELIELIRRRGYFSNFDSDFRESYVESLFNDLKKSHVDKDIYLNGRWYCLENKIPEYEVFVKQITNLNKLIHIYKTYDFIER